MFLTSPSLAADFFIFFSFSQRAWKDHLRLPDVFVKETPTHSPSIAGRRHADSQAPAGSPCTIPFTTPALPDLFSVLRTHKSSGITATTRLPAPGQLSSSSPHLVCSLLPVGWPRFPR